MRIFSSSFSCSAICPCLAEIFSFVRFDLGLLALKLCLARLLLFDVLCDFHVLKNLPSFLGCATLHIALIAALNISEQLLPFSDFALLFLVLLALLLFDAAHHFGAFEHFLLFGHHSLRLIFAQLRHDHLRRVFGELFASTVTRSHLLDGVEAVDFHQRIHLLILHLSLRSDQCLFRQLSVADRRAFRVKHERVHFITLSWFFRIFALASSRICCRSVC